MTPRRPATPRAKRDELQTYRDLALGRELKTKTHRRRIEATGKRRVLGDGSTAQPYLAVETARYREVRLEVSRRLLLEAKKAGLELPPDLLLEQLSPRIEALTYAQLARETDDAVASQNSIPELGRSLTPEERRRFAASSAAGLQGEGKNPRRKNSDTALSKVLGRIEDRQSHNPARYQTVWAGLVGAEAAQQTWLERIDPATQTAYFRCLNSVLSSHLQRLPGLPQKLSKALGLPIRRLRAQF